MSENDAQRRFLMVSSAVDRAERDGRNASLRHRLQQAQLRRLREFIGWPRRVKQ